MADHQVNIGVGLQFESNIEEFLARIQSRIDAVQAKAQQVGRGAASTGRSEDAGKHMSRVIAEEHGRMVAELRGRTDLNAQKLDKALNALHEAFQTAQTRLRDWAAKEGLGGKIHVRSDSVEARAKEFEAAVTKTGGMPATGSAALSANAAIQKRLEEGQRDQVLMSEKMKGIFEKAESFASAMEHGKRTFQQLISDRERLAGLLDNAEGGLQQTTIDAIRMRRQRISAEGELTAAIEREEQILRQTTSARLSAEQTKRHQDRAAIDTRTSDDLNDIANLRERRLKERHEIEKRQIAGRTEDDRMEKAGLDLIKERERASTEALKQQARTAEDFSLEAEIEFYRDRARDFIATDKATLDSEDIDRSARKKRRAEAEQRLERDDLRTQAEIESSRRSDPVLQSAITARDFEQARTRAAQDAALEQEKASDETLQAQNATAKAYRELRETVEAAASQEAYNEQLKANQELQQATLRLAAARAEAAALEAEIADHPEARAMRVAADTARTEADAALKRDKASSDDFVRAEARSKIDTADLKAQVNDMQSAMMAERGPRYGQATRFQMMQHSIAERQGGAPRDPASFMRFGQFLSARALTTGGFMASGALIYGGIQTLKDMFNESTALQQEFAIIQTQLDNIGETAGGISFEGVRDEIRGISVDVGVAADRTAEMTRQLAGAFSDPGTGTPNMERALVETETAMKAAKILGITDDQAKGELLAISIAFADDDGYQKPFEEILDQAVLLEETIGGYTPAMLEFSASIAPIAKEVGFTVEQMMALGATLNQSTNLAGSKLADDISRLFPQLHDAQTKIYEIIESSPSTRHLVPDLVEAMGQNRMDEVFRILAEAYPKLGSAQGDLRSVVDPRLSRVFGTILSRGEATIAALDAEPGEGDGKFEKRWDEYAKTIKNKLEQVKQEVRAFGAVLMDAGLMHGLTTLVDLFRGLASVLTGVATLFQELNDRTGGFAGRLIGVVGAVKALSMASRTLKLGELLAMSGGGLLGPRALAPAAFGYGMAGPLGGLGGLAVGGAFEMAAIRRAQAAQGGGGGGLLGGLGLGAMARGAAKTGGTAAAVMAVQWISDRQAKDRKRVEEDFESLGEEYQQMLEDGATFDEIMQKAREEGQRLYEDQSIWTRFFQSRRDRSDAGGPGIAGSAWRALSRGTNWVITLGGMLGSDNPAHETQEEAEEAYTAYHDARIEAVTKIQEGLISAFDEEVEAVIPALRQYAASGYQSHANPEEAKRLADKYIQDLDAALEEGDQDAAKSIMAQAAMYLPEVAKARNEAAQRVREVLETASGDVDELENMWNEFGEDSEGEADFQAQLDLLQAQVQTGEAGSFEVIALMKSRRASIENWLTKPGGAVGEAYLRKLLIEAMIGEREALIGAADAYIQGQDALVGIGVLDDDSQLDAAIQRLELITKSDVASAADKFEAAIGVSQQRDAQYQRRLSEAQSPHSRLAVMDEEFVDERRPEDANIVAGLVAQSPGLVEAFKLFDEYEEFNLNEIAEIITGVMDDGKEFDDEVIRVLLELEIARREAILEELREALADAQMGVERENIQKQIDAEVADIGALREARDNFAGIPDPQKGRREQHKKDREKEAKEAEWAMKAADVEMARAQLRSGDTVGAAQLDVLAARVAHDRLADTDPDNKAGLRLAAAQIVAAERAVGDAIRDRASRVAQAYYDLQRAYADGNPFQLANIAMAQARDAMSRAREPEEVYAAQAAYIQGQQQMRDAQRASDMAFFEYHSQLRSQNPVSQAAQQLVAARRALSYARPGEEYWRAMAGVVAAQQAVQAANEDVGNAFTEYAATLVAPDGVRHATQNLRNARRAVSLAKDQASRYRALAAELEAKRALDMAILDVFVAQADLAAAVAESTGNMVESSRQAVRIAQERLRVAQKQGAGKAETAQIRAEITRAQTAYTTEQRQDRLGDLEYLYEFDRITASRYIELLRAEMMKIPEANKTARREIERRIKALRDEMSSNVEFNIPGELRLPTLYEIRRMDQISSYGHGQSYQDNRTITININESQDPQGVINTINGALGAPPTSSGPGLY